jgi:TPR repeat protein
MKKMLSIAALVLLLPVQVQAQALEPITPAGAMGIYDDALKSYSCVDYDKALRLFMGNAEQGHALSQYMVGVMLSAGQGAPEDDKAAFDWFMRASKQNLADAHYALGDMLKKGEGVVKDPAQALFWFKLAANGGHSLATDMVNSMTTSLPADQIESIFKNVRDWQAQMTR